MRDHHTPTFITSASEFYSLKMPTLRQYVRSSKKSGYYIRANVGASYPVTLQVTGLATRILQEAGFSDGDTVPTKLVWSLFDIGLLYTESTHNIPEDKGDALSTFTDSDISATLSAETKNRLIEFLETYEGAEQEKMQQLKAELEAHTPTGSPQTEETPQEQERFGTPFPERKEDLISLIFVWAGYPSPAEFRRLKQRVNRQTAPILDSVQSFYYHPLLTDSIYITEYYTVEYELETEAWGRVIVEDYRHLAKTEGRTEEIDFRLSFPEVDNGSFSTPVIDGTIQETTAEIDEQEITAQLLDPIEAVASQPIESIEHKIKPIHDFIDVDTYGDFLDHEGEILGSARINIPFELKKELNTAEAVDIHPMESFPDPDAAGEIVIGKVDRISNSGNPVVILPSGGHTLLPGGEEGEFYILYKNNSGHKSRPLGRIITT